MGTARTMRSAKRTTSSVDTARAPAASTSTISAMRSPGPDPDIATSYPAATAARAMVVPTLPAPTMPRRRSADSPLDTGGSSNRRRQAGGIRLLGRMCEQFPDPRNHLSSVQLDGRHPLLLGYSPSRVRPVEPAEPELPTDARSLGRNRFRRTEIQRTIVDLGLKAFSRGTRPTPLGRRVLEYLRPVRPLNLSGFRVGPGPV